MTRLLLIYILCFIGTTIFTGNAMAIEEPKYTVIEKEGDVELRLYSPKIIAEVLVTGTMDEASSKGFKLVADYIFGNNTAGQGDSEKISMTAPVSMKPASEKVSMTAPVIITASDEVPRSDAKVGTDVGANVGSHDQGEQQWRLHFVMPSEYTLDTLPLPNNPAVKLREVPAKKVAVIRFSGLVNQNKFADKTAALMAWLDSKGIKPHSSPELARYNPPWTLPFLRRNEVMLAY